jgi:hypothetical protein
MKVDQVIRLLEAGYSKEEIQQMEQGAQEPQEQETTKQEPAPEQPEQKTEPAAAEQDQASKPEEKGPAAETAPDPETNKRLDGIEAQLKQLVKSIQAENVRRDSYGSAGIDIDTQADKAMASLIGHNERSE